MSRKVLSGDELAEAFAEIRSLRGQIKLDFWQRNPRLAEMSIEQLKRLWDAYDGTNRPLGFDGEDIHLALNLRGAGSYCAV